MKTLIKWALGVFVGWVIMMHVGLMLAALGTAYGNWLWLVLFGVVL